MQRTHRRWRTALLAVGATVAAVGTIGAIAMTTASAATTGRITSAANGKCLDVTDGSTADGNQPQMWTCYTGSANQTWTFADDGSVRGLGKCLDVANGSTADGAVVHMWTCYSTVASQKWQLNAAGDLVNTAAGKCLDIKDNNLADGAKLQLWSCAGTANQKWTFSGGTTNPTPTATATGVPNNPNNPDLGPNVSVFGRTSGGRRRTCR
ncbi:RICIN domain-containing protein [Dactylosporangium aurantiacum]|uniref:ricin-type beta-trefoil lectin domain protein n=1 Tax=Dactylosporangium aurantiacum TaxID=35754 RepID=UPI000694DE10